MQWNLRGFKSNRLHLLDAIDSIKPDIICLQETHLKQTHMARLPSFQHPPCRFDRKNSKGGGTLISLRVGIPFIEY